MKRDSVYDETAVAVPVSPFVGMSFGELLRTVLCGVGVGLVVAVGMFLLNKFIFGAVLCRPQSIAECAQAPTYAMIVAMVLGAIAGLLGLARMRMYRPLLVVLAATIALWGINSIVSGMVWYWAALAVMVIFGLAYGLFAWIARIRNFVMALVITIVVVVLVRFLLVG